MRVIYFGTSEFAVPALKALADSVVLVVSQPPRQSGRGMNVHSSPVHREALRLGLPVEHPEKSRDPAFVDRLRALNSDALVVASYGQILSQAMLDSAVRGGINLHGSILPKYRGAAPIQRAIQNGEIETGVTLMQMDRGMDTGDIISISNTQIGPDETYGELLTRLSLVSAEMAVQWMPRIVAGDYPRASQDSSKATMAPKVERAETELKFNEEAETAYRKFRAFTPLPGTFVQTSLGTLKLREARMSSETGSIGSVLSVTPELQVGFGNGSLILKTVQPEGKKAMSGRDWANGARMKTGASLIA